MRKRPRYGSISEKRGGARREQESCVVAERNAGYPSGGSAKVGSYVGGEGSRENGKKFVRHMFWFHHFFFAFTPSRKASLHSVLMVPAFVTNGHDVSALWCGGSWVA